jgi:peptidoglycan/xylan/chitin deacetylase (PgdA/CDA1 family)
MTTLQGLRKQFGINKKMANLYMAFGLLFTMGFGAVPKTYAISQPTAKVSFTFDDGLTSADQYAMPILKADGLTGTDYVISGCVGMTTAPNTCHANADATYMTWAQINDLKANGWEIGSHTVDHACLASSATQDADDCTAPYGGLTATQVSAELTTSALTIGTNTGVTPTDFATPYGDWLPPVLSNIAKTYASHRGFADTIDADGNGVIDHGNTYPYNDYLLYDYRVQGDGTIAGGVTVAQVESMIDQTIANNQWLVLTFHDVIPNASPDPANYQYSTTNFQAIADYVKAKGIQNVNINGGLVINTGNLLANSSFDAALSSNTADTTSWSTDDPIDIKQDTAGNGSYPSPANSVSLTGTTKDAHLFSPQVPVNSTKTYVLKNYLNVTNMAVATGHEVGFYIDEYDANGVYLQTQYKKSEVGNNAELNGAWVENLNFTYLPTSASVAKARYQVVVTANSGAQAYLDNVQWFAQDGSTTGGQGAGGKAGDVNGDGAVNSLDLSIMLTHWNQAGQTHNSGDLSGDGAVNSLDLSILLTNWNK